MSPRISISLLPALSDERLVSLASQGHERAFETFVQRYRAQLLSYCRRMGLSEWRAEEVLQQALLQVWMALGSGTQVRDPKPWLYRIVHNGAVNAVRRTSEDHAELTEVIHDRAVVAGETFPQRPMAMREALDEVVALPQMQREAVLLTAIEGQTHLEVAGTLGISHDAVRGLLYRARATLRGAAASLAPESLICWLSGGTGGGAPAAARVAELSGAGGAVGMTGALLKGAVVAVSAGILVGGAAVGTLHPHAARRPHAAGAPRAALLSARNAGSEAPGTAPGNLIASISTGVPVAARQGPQPAVAHVGILAPLRGARLISGPALPRPGVRPSPPDAGSPGERGDLPAPGHYGVVPQSSAASSGSSSEGNRSRAQGTGQASASSGEQGERPAPGHYGVVPQSSAASSGSSSEGDSSRGGSTEQAGPESGTAEGRGEPAQPSAGDE